MTRLNETKPHHGGLKDWYKVRVDGGLGYTIAGTFVDHPKENFEGKIGATAFVVAIDHGHNEVETQFARYSLLGPERNIMRQDL